MTFFQERESDMKCVMPDYKLVLHTNVCLKEILSRTKHHVSLNKMLAKLETKILHSLKPLHCDLVLPSFLLCYDQVESRTTTFQERGDDEDILVLVITTCIHGQIQDQMQHTSKVKATNEDCIILSHRYYLLPIYLSFVDQRELRTTLHQGREDDECMATIYVTLQQRVKFSWKELLSRTKQTHSQVNANLNPYLYVCFFAMLSSFVAGFTQAQCRRNLEVLQSVQKQCFMPRKQSCRVHGETSFC